MREMMVAASLIAVSACGAIEPVDTAEFPPDEMTDMGSGSGSGSGSADEPTKCTTAADCGGGGMACDFATRECVVGALTLDAIDFVNDGLRWWTNTTGPELSGTFDGPAAAVVQVKVGTNAGTLATIVGTRWSLQLPPGTITPAGTLITVMMTDPSGGVVTLEQVLTLDNVAPVLEQTASTLRDERGDVITFSGDAPIHDHQGAAIDLTAAGCPAVYKYAYLMDSQAPSFGSEVTPNPLAWRFAAADAKVESGEYRVRAADGAVLRDWSSLAAVGPELVVPLYRSGTDGIAKLGTTAGNYHLDVRVRDWAGLEATLSTCWNHQPLAAPLEIGAVQSSTATNALMGWSLATSSPVSRILAATHDAALFDQRIVQHTAEPIVIAVGSSKPVGTYERSALVGWIGMAVANSLPCSQIDCSAVPPTLAAPQVSSGVLDDYAIGVRLVDDVTGQDIPIAVGKVTLPARGPNEPPHSYTLRVSVNQVTKLRPSSTIGATFVETGACGKNFTGRLFSNTRACTTPAVMNCKSGTCVMECPYTIYVNIEALDHAKVSLPPLTTSITTAPTMDALLRAPAHVASSTYISPPFVWDSGNDDLPGDLY